MAFFVANPLAAFVIAIIAGFVPVLLWLWLFEHEDKHPEPKKLVALAFCAGIAAVICVIPFEEAAYHAISATVIVIIAWSIIEEVAKYFAAELSVLRRAENHEPIDSMMYMIATALGFAALENVLFIIRPLLTGNIATALATVGVRFFGPSLIHVVCSSLVGYGLALSFGKSRLTKVWSVILSLCTASALHAFFDLSILSSRSGSFTYLYFIWLAAIGVLFLFEKIKKIKT